MKLFLFAVLILISTSSSAQIRPNRYTTNSEADVSWRVNVANHGTNFGSLTASNTVGGTRYVFVGTKTNLSVDPEIGDGAQGIYFYESGDVDFVSGTTGAAFFLLADGAIDFSPMNPGTFFERGVTLSSGDLNMHGGTITSDTGTIIFTGNANFSGGSIQNASISSDEITIGTTGNNSSDGFLTFSDDGTPVVGFDGSTLVNLNASQISSGTVPLARLPNQVTNGLFFTGRTNIGSLATSLTIFLSGHTMPNTNYCPVVSIIGGSLASSTTASFSALTTTNFVLNLSVGITGGDQLAWSVSLSP